MRQVIFLCIALLVMPSHVFPQSISTALRLEDVYSMLHLKTGIDVSPDGEIVAFTLEDRRKKNGPKQSTRAVASGEMVGCDVWITDTKLRVSRNLTRGRGNSWGAVWSPNSQQLAFYSDRAGEAHLWVWERTTNQLRQVSNVVIAAYSYGNPLWTPDQKQILVRLRPEKMLLASERIEAGRLRSESNPTGKSGVTVRLYRSPLPARLDDLASKRGETAGQLGILRSDLGLIDLATGRAQRIARGIIPRWTRISPDGARVAFTVMKPGRPETGWQGYADLVLVEFATRSTRTIVTDIMHQAGAGISWSPNGQALAYTSSGPEAGGQLFVAASDGSGIREIAAGKHPSLSHSYLPPLWDRAGRYLYAVGDGALWRLSPTDNSAGEIAKIPQRISDIVPDASRNLIWSTRGEESVVVIARNDEHLQSGFYKVELKTGGVSPLFVDNQDLGGSAAILKMDVAAQRDRLVFATGSAHRSEELFLAEDGCRKVSQLGRVNSQIDHKIMGLQRVIDWIDAGGKRHRGLMLLPSNYRKGIRYPLIVWVYAESMNYANTFGFWGDFFNMQFFATRGYAVFFPHVPIRKGEPMKGVAEIVLPGIDRVVELGIADENRIGVMGHSYGGYVTLSLIVQSTRFKAAVDSAGPGNMFSIYGIPLNEDGTTFGIPWTEGQEGMKGSPWESREQYVRNSPWFFLDRVETPLLILQGTEDPCCVAQSDEIFVGLRRLGKRVEYAKYHGEQHSPFVWSYANKIDAAQRMIQWFEVHLKLNP